MKRAGLALALLCASAGFARAEDPSPSLPLAAPGDVPAAIESLDAPSPFSLFHRPDKPRNAFWPPLLSFVIPGLDQWFEEQYRYGAIYSGTALGGLYALPALSTSNFAAGIEEGDDRLSMYGLQLVMFSGEMSAYHSFRTAARSRQSKGDYLFLKHEETPVELALAPFKFSLLMRPTTLIPFGLAAALGVVVARDVNGHVSRLSGSDAFFGFGFSYNAGVGEEALFRGWLLPWLRESTGSGVAANLLSSLLFGAAHLGGDFVPWPQTVLGSYLGWVAQKNDYAISESIFIHVWWDVFLIGSSYLEQSIRGVPRSERRVPTVWLPLLNVQF